MVSLPTFVRQQKSGQTHRREIGTRIFNIFSNTLGTAGISFGTADNTKYDLPNFTTMLTEMSRSRITAESVAADFETNKDAPCGKWIRNMINDMSSDQAEHVCNEMILQTARPAIKAIIHKTDALIAIDKHLIPRYDKGNLAYLVRSKAYKGTTKFEAYATMQIVAKDENPTLDCVPITRDDSDVDFVRRFAKKLQKYKIRPRLLLLDREFFSVEVMESLYENHHTFLMPAVKNAIIKKNIIKFHDGKAEAVSSHTMKNNKGQEFTFTLVIRKSKKYNDPDAKIIEKYVVFATNLSHERAIKEIEMLPKAYRRRWGIETGYRQLEQFRPRTSSRNHLFRIFLFFISIFMRNMWALTRYDEVTHSSITMRQMIGTVMVCALEYIRIVGMPYDAGGTS